MKPTYIGVLLCVTGERALLSSAALEVSSVRFGPMRDLETSCRCEYCAGELHLLLGQKGCLEVSSRASLEECKVWRIRSMAMARWRPSTSPALFFPEGWKSQKISPLRACGLMALYSGCAVGGVVNVVMQASPAAEMQSGLLAELLQVDSGI